MKKKYRLLKEVDFQYLLRRGNKIYTTNFVCYWKRCDCIENIKIGIIIPKKKCRLSCNRKYCKRLFWAINNGVLDDLPKIKCVFFYKESFFNDFANDKLNFSNLRREYLKLMLHLQNYRR